MAREIKTIIWCDPCIRTDGGPVYNDATEVEVAIGDTRALMAFCESHMKSISELRDLVADVSRENASVLPAATVAQKLKDPMMERCGMPGCGKVMRRTGLQGHLRTVHDTTMPAYAREMAQAGVAIGVHDGKGNWVQRVPELTPVEDLPDDARCPQCGEGFDPQLYVRPPMARALHEKNVHGAA